MKTTITRIPSGTTGELWHWAEEKRRSVSAPASQSRSSLTMASGILRRMVERISRRSRSR